MTSNDVYVVIGGQSYRIDGETLRPIESDFQREVLKRLDGIDARLGVLEQEVTIIKHDQATLQTSVYWALGAVGIFIAAVSLPSIIAGVVSAFRRPEPPKEERVNFTVSLTDLLVQALKAERDKTN